MYIEITLGELKKRCRKTYVRICKNERQLKPEWKVVIFDMWSYMMNRPYTKEFIYYEIFDGNKKVYCNNLFEPWGDEEKSKYNINTLQNKGA